MIKDRDQKKLTYRNEIFFAFGKQRFKLKFACDSHQLVAAVHQVTFARVDEANHLGETFGINSFQFDY